MKKTVLFFIIVLLLAGTFSGCQKNAEPVNDSSVTESVTQADVVLTPEPTAEPTPTPTAEPTPTPEPTPTVIRIGAVGDIMVMATQVYGALDDATGAYDFSRSYIGVADQFRSVDFMMGNFECTLAGEEAGYSKKKTDEERVDTFNAPDSVIDTLMDVGFDFLSTANNHALDRKMPGLLRTLDVLDEKGIPHKGTARSDEERDTPLVVDVNGIKLGIVSATEIINKHDKWMTAEEASYAVNRLSQQTERLGEEIQACRDAGADFVIAYPHWDKEHKHGPNALTRETAKRLFEQGVDLIFGSHPHVVQPIDYMTVTRNDGTEYTGLLVYSMGNFISNMAPGPLKYGLYVEVEIEKDTDGATTLKSAQYMPTYCFVRSEGKKYVHQVVPALADVSRIKAYSELRAKELEEVVTAREHVIDICGDVIPVMEDTCWIN